jgi:hypothetical protein
MRVGGLHGLAVAPLGCDLIATSPLNGISKAEDNAPLGTNTATKSLISEITPWFTWGFFQRDETVGRHSINTRCASSRWRNSVNCARVNCHAKGCGVWLESASYSRSLTSTSAKFVNALGVSTWR